MDKRNKEIKASLEYLRKLFIMPDSPDKFMEFGQQLLEMIHHFFKEKGGIHSSITLPELSRIFNQTSIPDQPHLIKDVLEEIRDKVAAHSVRVGSPYYIGHMISAVPYFMILLEMIIATLNQNQVKIETAKASSFVERELVAWFHRLIFDRSERFYEKNIQNPRIALGNVTSDGTIANLTALAVAREKAFPPDGKFPGVRAAGMKSALSHYKYDKGVILVSTRGHYSIRKAANLLGMGEENVINVPVDRFNRIDIKKLNRKIESLEGQREKTKVIAIVGIAGTTETGNVDNLQKLGEISRRIGSHFHVDACWGGSAMLVEEYRPMFEGIEEADSVSIDAHKLLYCPMSMGLVLFRNEKDLNYLKHTSNYIIRRNSVDTGRFTIEGSRPFACLKPWASLKIMGRDGYRLLFKSARANTDSLKEIIDGCGNFETLNIPELFIINYRFIPAEVKLRLTAWQQEKNRARTRKERQTIERRVRKINRLINALNVKLHKALRMDDTTFVSRTTLESTKYRPQNIVVLRAVLSNPLTDRGILEEIVRTQNRLGMRLWKEFEQAYKKALSNEKAP
ncbi:MAG: aminotransferase class V-fold PLP-dependent enzyme [Deltaproteobacteria bacterium]|nr:aminotransferase class V-fold PLP-dependent enzyme [Deltaproteobacteria bacterium]